MMGSNGRSRAFTSRNRGVVASAWLFQSGIPADSNSRPTVFNGSNRQLRHPWRLSRDPDEPASIDKIRNTFVRM